MLVCSVLAGYEQAWPEVRRALPSFPFRSYSPEPLVSEPVVHTPRVVRKSVRKREREEDSDPFDDQWRDQWYNYLQETKRIEQRHHLRVLGKRERYLNRGPLTCDLECIGEGCPCHVKVWRFENARFNSAAFHKNASWFRRWDSNCRWQACFDLRNICEQDEAGSKYIDLKRALEFVKYDEISRRVSLATADHDKWLLARRTGRDVNNPFFFWNQRLWNKCGWAGERCSWGQREPDVTQRDRKEDWSHKRIRSD